MAGWRHRFWDRLITLSRALAASVKGYLVDVRGELAGLQVLKALALGGPRFWLGLAVLLLSLLATVYLRLGADHLRAIRAEAWEGQWISLPSLALWLASLVMAFGWTYLLSGAAGYGLLAYTVAVVYVVYYGLLSGMPQAARAWFPLLPFWLMLQGAWLALQKRSPWHWPALLALCLVGGLVSYQAVGLRISLPGIGGQLVLGLLFFALLAVPLFLQRRGWPGIVYRPRVAFAITLLLFLLFYTLTGLGTEPEEWLQLTFLSFHGLLGIVGLFWFWMGLDLFGGAQDLTDWLLTTAQRLFSLRALTTCFSLLWLLWIGFAYLAAHPPPLWFVLLLDRFRWGQMILATYASWQPSDLLATVMALDLYPTLALLLLAIALRLRGKLTEEGLVDLFGTSLLVLLIIWGGMGLFFAFGESSREPLGFWPLLLYVGGMFWQILMNSDDLVGGSERRLYLFVGFLLCLAGISLLELVARYARFEQELSLNAFNGVLYLGAPYLLYTYLYQQRRYTPVPQRQLLLLFALGMLTAVLVLLGLPLLTAPLCWAIILWAAVWRQGRWDDLADGVVYGLALGLGFAAFRTHPLVLPLPLFVPLLADQSAIQASWSQAVIWPWEVRWWLFSLGVAASAAVLGLFFGLAHRRSAFKRWVLIAASILLSVILMVGPWALV